jgi:hypothetical protein
MDLQLLLLRIDVVRSFSLLAGSIALQLLSKAIPQSQKMIQALPQPRIRRSQ